MSMTGPPRGTKRAKEDVGSYLESFLEHAANLPAEIQRNFTLMREIDQKVLDLQTKIEKDYKNFLSGKTQKNSDSLKLLLDQVKADQEHCLDFSDEKISLASQTYDRVDNHIRQLDADLRRFEDDFNQDEPAGPRIMKKSRGGEPGRTINVDLDLAVDPNEPVYCICKQVSFGEMIACDNADCPTEWFHFQCVGLTTTNVKGNRWYCPDCRARARQGQLKLA
eukprot:CAMPEP_0175948186 /NCGR_PEP_ID=MMETSP0108-20121206/28308_1 /TAXON_ID=195067 ORGANISM="Goniomonas pacifica, Strain CCMP1869" /NCGR_SAMPLE_ID=MMETSP0108 /ASSEMBLY_ACC=CAM_ASM_000204 /LENGTH=221 /DNA_ID=CAMNT_0017273913 /DNA_START=8 /DNA_END=673 /DNA_ORIENTATION=-